MKKTPDGDEESKAKDSKEARPIRLYSELVPIIERLFEAAKAGDVGAAGTLVTGAEIMAWFVQSLFKATPESREMVRRIASETLHWPTVVCPINEDYGPDWTRDYLKELGLGSALNVSPRKRDDRTTKEERIAVARLMRLARQEGHSFTRGGMSRNEWMKSEHGKAARKAVKDGLRMLYDDEGWLDCPLLFPLVSRAQKIVEAEDRRVNGLEHNEPAKATRTAIKTAFFKEALSLIHGGLGD